MNWLLLPALLLLAAAPAGAVDRGSSGAQFLKLGAGARAGGMADAFTATADDASAAYYNPAGLSQLKGAQLMGAHSSYFQGLSYEAIDFAYPWGREEGFSRHTVAAGIYYLSVGDIERRVSDTTGNIGTFGASDGAYALSYAYAFDGRLSLGGTGKYIAQELDSYRATAFAVDGGALYRMNPKAERPVTLGAAVRNIGTRPSFAGVSDPLPVGMTVGVGAEVIPNAMKLDLDVGKYRDTDPYVALGGEYRHHFNDAVKGALRFGYTSVRRDNEGLNGLAFGGGLQFHKAGFDFAWQPFGHLGDTFRYSLVVKF